MAKVNKVYFARALNASGETCPHRLRIAQFEPIDIDGETVVLRVDPVLDDEQQTTGTIRISNGTLALSAGNHSEEWFEETYKGYRRKTDDGTILLLMAIEQDFDSKSTSKLDTF